MKESNAMLEIRRIRDENSLRHSRMNSDEISKETKKSVDWFLKTIGKPIKIVLPEVRRTPQ